MTKQFGPLTCYDTTCSNCSTMPTTKRLKKTDRIDAFDVAVVHKNCVDGDSCAALLDHVGFTGVIYGWNLANKFSDVLTDKRVLFCDCCPTQETLQLWKMRDFYVVDHHPKAKELATVYPEKIYFDTEECGCTLLWKWFMQDQQCSDQMKAIRAYDTGRFDEFPSWDFLYTAIELLPRSTDETRTCPKCLSLILFESFTVTEEIRAITMYKRKMIQRIAKTKCIAKHRLGPDEGNPKNEQRVWVVECPDVQFRTLVCRSILNSSDALPDDIVIAFSYNGKEKTFGASVRAHEKSNMALARRFAKIYGGEGHGNASGCGIDVQAFLNNLHFE